MEFLGDYQQTVTAIGAMALLMFVQTLIVDVVGMRAKHVPGSTVAADHELDDANFPKGMLDINNQQIDLRSENSWLLRLGQVSTPERDRHS